MKRKTRFWALITNPLDDDVEIHDFLATDLDDAWEYAGECLDHSPFLTDCRVLTKKQFTSLLQETKLRKV